MELCKETFLNTYFEDSFGEFVSDIYVSLQKKDTKYKDFLDKKEKILVSFPNLRAILEDNEITDLTKEEVTSLIKYLHLQDDQKIIEERELFFKGILEAYSFLNN